MTDDTRSLDLGALAVADSPEVVRAALTSFRRRVFVRAAWLALVIVVAWIMIPTFGSNDVPGRFLGARGVALGVRADAGRTQVTVIDVRRLDERTVGVHLMAASDAVARGRFLLATQDTLTASEQAAGFVQRGDFHHVFTAGGGRSLEAWIDLPAGTPGFVIAFVSTGGDNANDIRLDAPTDRMPATSAGDLLVGRFVFDFEQFDVPDTIWR